MKTILVLSPHPDDGILGCGGTISKFLEEGKEIYYIVFSWLEQGFSFGEIESSLDILGIKKENITYWDYRVRNFTDKRQAILDDLLKLREKIRPDLVLCHSTSDRHQDHIIVRQEAFRAFKNVSIWGYELGWNVRDFKTDIFASLNNRHIENKIKALRCMPSQNSRRYFNPKRREAHAIFRGEQIDRDFAEAFESISQII